MSRIHRMTAMCAVMCVSMSCLGQVWSAVVGGPPNSTPCATQADCELAVSPNRVLVATNCKLAMFDLSGNRLEDRFVSGGFWADDPLRQADYHRDQRCHFDPLSERFWIAATHVDFGELFTFRRFALARSRVSQPTLDPADWVFFEWDLTSHMQGFVDRPSLAMDQDYIYAAIRDAENGPFEDTRTIVFIKSKADLLACTQPPCTLNPPVVIDLDLAVNPEGDETWAHAANLACGCT